MLDTKAFLWYNRKDKGGMSMKRTISGMMGGGSIRHNNRAFIASNVDPERVKDNIVFCNDNLKKVYEELFAEPLVAYNASKKKTRDKIPDYMEHIRNSKQEKLYYESIFQVGGMNDCACGTPEGELATEALKKFAEEFQARNKNLRVFNMVLHLDEATPHLHIDYVPFATGQTRGLSTKNTLKGALGQLGFKSQGRKQTEWKAWMDHEKEVLMETAHQYGFEIISLGGGRKHMKLPEYREATAELEIVRERIATSVSEIDELERRQRSLKSSVQLLNDVKGVKVLLDDIEPTKGFAGTVKGVSIEQIIDLKAMALRCVAAEHEAKELKEENKKLQSKIPSINETLKDKQTISNLQYQNRRLSDENEYLQEELAETRSFAEKIVDVINEVFDYLEEHLPQRFITIIEKAREFIPQPELDEQTQEHTWEMEM